MYEGGGFILLTDAEIAKLSVNEKKRYYNELREYTLGLKTSKVKTLGQNLISKLCPSLRSYDLEIIGEENLPTNDSAIIMCNHSNSHDFFTSCEAFSRLSLPVTVFAASDDLSRLSNSLFAFANATLVDRDSDNSKLKGTFEFAGKILAGNYGVIFGESTWNLHPNRVMQNLKKDASKVASMTGKVIIPAIFEYVEIPDLCLKECELYTKCIVKFGKPVEIKLDKDLVSQTAEIENIMISMRMELWEKLGIISDKNQKNNPIRYVNHTWLKKFGGLGFNYDSESEFKYLLFKDGQKRENEYHLNEFGSFVPGVTQKSEKEKALVLK